MPIKMDSLIAINKSLTIMPQIIQLFLLRFVDFAKTEIPSYYIHKRNAFHKP